MYVWVLMDISSAWKNLPWTRAWLKSAQLWLQPPSMLFWPCLFPGTKQGVLVVGQHQTWDDDLLKSQNSKFHAAGKDLMATSMLLLHSRPRSYRKAVRLGLCLYYVTWKTLQQFSDESKLNSRLPERRFLHITKAIGDRPEERSCKDCCQAL